MGMPTRNLLDIEPEIAPAVVSGGVLEGPPRKRGRSVYVPLDENGKLDSSRIKDPSKLEAAKQALIDASAPPAPPPEPPKIPREYVAPIYDLLSTLIGIGVRIAKWPRVMSTEQRAYFASQLKYSDEFKEKATEPTANLLDKYVGKSKVAAWLIENKDVAILAKLLAEETQNMFMRAALAFNAEMLKQAEIAAAEKATKPNGGYGASEFRGPSA